MNIHTYILQRKWLLIFCGIGLIVNLISFYPGFMTADSLDQYKQSLTAHYDDWHPPIMAMLWRLTNKISSGPQSLFAFQLILFWICSFLLLDTISGKRWVACIGIMLMAPFVQNFVGYIIKDTEMALTWMLAFTLMYRASRRNSNITIVEWFLCFFLLLYGTMVRTNALPGVVPLCFMLSWTSLKRRKTGLMIAGGVGVLIIIVSAQLFIYQVMVKPVKTHPEDKLFLHDLSGLFVRTNQNVFPKILFENPGFDTAYIRKNYNTATFDDILENHNHLQIMDPDRELTRELFKAWFSGVSKYPLVYLSNRFDGFLYYLRIKNRREFNYYIYYIEPNRFGFVIRPNIVAKIVVNYIKKQGDMFYMKPWFWLLLNTVLFFFMPRITNKADKVAYTILLSSSLLYLLPGFFIYPTDTDFRYFYWNCIACSIALCILVTESSKKIKPVLQNKP